MSKSPGLEPEILKKFFQHLVICENCGKLGIWLLFISFTAILGFSVNLVHKKHLAEHIHEQYLAIDIVQYSHYN